MFGSGLLGQFLLLLLLAVAEGSLKAELSSLRGVQRWRRTQVDGYVSVIFPNNVPQQFQDAFNEAADFWNNIIKESTLNPITLQNAVNVAQFGCGVSFTFQAGDRIDGLAILAVIEPIDGRGGTLGAASPCIPSTSVDGRSLPRVGFMRFDEVDMAAQSLASTAAVIRHEMGHVLGIGSLWRRWGNNLVANPCTQVQTNPNGPCNANPTYIGAKGIEGFQELGGQGPLPAANFGGFGTVNAHWRESTFQGELMTGFLSGGVEASRMSLKSMEDLGYIVNLGAAETFQIPGVPLPPPPVDDEWEDIDNVPENPPIEEIDAEIGRSKTIKLVAAIIGSLAFVAFVGGITYKRNQDRRNRDVGFIGKPVGAMYSAGPTFGQNSQYGQNGSRQNYYATPQPYPQNNYPAAQPYPNGNYQGQQAGGSRNKRGGNGHGRGRGQGRY